VRSEQVVQLRSRSVPAGFRGPRGSDRLRRPVDGCEHVDLGDAPHADRDAPGDTHHLGDRGRRVGNESDDELGQRHVELAGLERQRLRRSLLHPKLRKALSQHGDELWQRIGRGNRRAARNELAGECAGAGPHVEHT
jgi:hypothetical protein